MSPLLYLLLLAVPLAVAWGAGYLIGRLKLSDDIEEARWDAFDTALDANTDEAWDVYYAAYPRETK